MQRSTRQRRNSFILIFRGFSRFLLHTNVEIHIFQWLNKDGTGHGDYSVRLPCLIPHKLTSSILVECSYVHPYKNFYGFVRKFLYPKLSDWLLAISFLAKKIEFVKYGYCKPPNR